MSITKILRYVPDNLNGGHRACETRFASIEKPQRPLAPCGIVRGYGDLTQTIRLNREGMRSWAVYLENLISQ
jgi:hypothetical protein